MARKARTPRRPEFNQVGQRILYTPCCDASRPKIVPQAYASDKEFVDAVAELHGNKTVETLTLEDLPLLAHTKAGMDMLMKVLNHYAAHHQRECLDRDVFAAWFACDSLGLSSELTVAASIGSPCCATVAEAAAVARSAFS